MDRGAWWASPRDCKESDMTEQLSTAQNIDNWLHYGFLHFPAFVLTLSNILCLHMLLTQQYSIIIIAL